MIITKPKETGEETVEMLAEIKEDRGGNGEETVAVPREAEDEPEKRKWTRLKGEETKIMSTNGRENG